MQQTSVWVLSSRYDDGSGAAQDECRPKTDNDGVDLSTDDEVEGLVKNCTLSLVKYSVT